MDSVEFQIGANVQQLQAALLAAERDFTRAIQQMERSLAAGTARMDSQFARLNNNVSRLSQTLNGTNLAGAGQQFDQLSSSVASASSEIANSTNNISSSLSDLSGLGSNISGIANQIQAAAAPLSTLALGAFAASGAVDALALSLGGRAFQAALQFQSVSLDLNKVLDTNRESLSQYQESAFALSQTFGTSAASALESIAVFRQAGFEAAEAAQLARDALSLAVVGDIDPGQASTVLQQSLAGFQADASQTGEIIDLLNEVSNNYGATLDQLSQGFARLSPVANQAGLSFRQTAAILTPAIEVFGSGVEAANAFRTVLARLASENKNVTETLESIGVNQRDALGAFRSGADILTDVGLAFQRVDENQRVFVASQLAGVQRASQFIASVTNLDTVLNIASDSFEVAGSAQRELEARLQGAEIQAQRTAQALANLDVSIGNQTLRDVSQLQGGIELLANTLSTEIDEGSFAPVFDSLQERIGAVGLTVTRLARTLPDALEIVNNTGGFDALSASIGSTFEGLLQFIRPLTTDANALAAAISLVANNLALLRNFAGGVTSVLAGVGATAAGIVSLFSSLDASTQMLLGTLAGVAVILSRFRVASLAVAAPLAIVQAAFASLSVAGGSLLGVLGALGAAGGLGILAATAGEVSGINDVLRDTLDTGSFDGFGDNIGAALSDSFARASTVVGPALDQVGGQLRAFAQDALASAGPALDQVATSIVSAFSLIPQALELADLSGFTEGFQSLVSLFTETSITAGDLAGFIESIGSAVSVVGDLVVSAGTAFAGYAGGILAVITAFNELSPLTQLILGGIAGISAVLAPLSGLFIALAGAIGLAVAALGQFAIISRLNGVLGATAVAARAATGAVTATGLAATATASRVGLLASGMGVLRTAFAVLTGPVGLAVGALSLIGVAFASFSDETDGFGQTISDLYDSFAGADTSDLQNSVAQAGDQIAQSRAQIVDDAEAIAEAATTIAAAGAGVARTSAFAQDPAQQAALNDGGGLDLGPANRDALGLYDSLLDIFGLLERRVVLTVDVQGATRETEKLAEAIARVGDAELEAEKAAIAKSAALKAAAEQAINSGQIEEAAALTRNQEILNAERQQQQQRISLQQQLNATVASIGRAQTQSSKQSQDDQTDAVKAAGRARLSAARKELTDIKSAERRNITEINRIRSDLATLDLNIDQQIQDIRLEQRGNPNNELIAAANTARRNASSAAAAAQRALTEEERAFNQEQAAGFLERASQLAGRVTDTRRQINLLQSLRRTQDEVLRSELAGRLAVQEQLGADRKAQEINVNAAKDAYDALKKDVEANPISIEFTIQSLIEQREKIISELVGLSNAGQDASTGGDQGALAQAQAAEANLLRLQATRDQVQELGANLRTLTDQAAEQNLIINTELQFNEVSQQVVQLREQAANVLGGLGADAFAAATAQLEAIRSEIATIEPFTTETGAVTGVTAQRNQQRLAELREARERVTDEIALLNTVLNGAGGDVEQRLTIVPRLDTSNLENELREGAERAISRAATTIQAPQVQASPQTNNLLAANQSLDEQAAKVARLRQFYAQLQNTIESTTSGGSQETLLSLLEDTARQLQELGQGVDLSGPLAEATQQAEDLRNTITRESDGVVIDVEARLQEINLEPVIAGADVDRIRAEIDERINNGSLFLTVPITYDEQRLSGELGLTMARLSEDLATELDFLVDPSIANPSAFNDVLANAIDPLNVDVSPSLVDNANLAREFAERFEATAQEIAINPKVVVDDAELADALETVSDSEVALDVKLGISAESAQAVQQAVGEIPATVTAKLVPAADAVASTQRQLTTEANATINTVAGDQAALQQLTAGQSAVVVVSPALTEGARAQLQAALDALTLSVSVTPTLADGETLTVDGATASVALALDEGSLAVVVEAVRAAAPEANVTLVTNAEQVAAAVAQATQTRTVTVDTVAGNTAAGDAVGADSSAVVAITPQLDEAALQQIQTRLASLDFSITLQPNAALLDQVAQQSIDVVVALSVVPESLAGLRQSVADALADQAQAIPVSADTSAIDTAIAGLVAPALTVALVLDNPDVGQAIANQRVALPVAATLDPASLDSIAGSLGNLAFIARILPQVDAESFGAAVSALANIEQSIEVSATLNTENLAGQLPEGLTVPVQAVLDVGAIPVAAAFDAAQVGGALPVDLTVPVDATLAAESLTVVAVLDASQLAGSLPADLTVPVEAVLNSQGLTVLAALDVSRLTETLPQDLTVPVEAVLTGQALTVSAALDSAQLASSLPAGLTVPVEAVLSGEQLTVLAVLDSSQLAGALPAGLTVPIEAVLTEQQLAVVATLDVSLLSEALPQDLTTPVEAVLAGQALVVEAALDEAALASSFPQNLTVPVEAVLIDQSLAVLADLDASQLAGSLPADLTVPVEAVLNGENLVVLAGLDVSRLQDALPQNLTVPVEAVLIGQALVVEADLNASQLADALPTGLTTSVEAVFTEQTLAVLADLDASQLAGSLPADLTVPVEAVLADGQQLVVEGVLDVSQLAGALPTDLTVEVDAVLADQRLAVLAALDTSQLASALPDNLTAPVEATLTGQRLAVAASVDAETLTASLPGNLTVPVEAALTVDQLSILAVLDTTDLADAVPGDLTATVQAVLDSPELLVGARIDASQLADTLPTDLTVTVRALIDSEGLAVAADLDASGLTEALPSDLSVTVAAGLEQANFQVVAVLDDSGLVSALPTDLAVQVAAQLDATQLAAQIPEALRVAVETDAEQLRQSLPSDLSVSVVSTLATALLQSEVPQDLAATVQATLSADGLAGALPDDLALTVAATLDTAGILDELPDSVALAVRPQLQTADLALAIDTAQASTIALDLVTNGNAFDLAPESVTVPVFYELAAGSIADINAALAALPSTEAVTVPVSVGLNAANVTELNALLDGLRSSSAVAVPVSLDLDATGPASLTGLLGTLPEVEAISVPVSLGIDSVSLGGLTETLAGLATFEAVTIPVGFSIAGDLSVALAAAQGTESVEVPVEFRLGEANANGLAPILEELSSSQVLTVPVEFGLDGASVADIGAALDALPATEGLTVPVELALNAGDSARLTALLDNVSTTEGATVPVDFGLDGTRLTEALAALPAPEAVAVPIEFSVDADALAGLSLGLANAASTASLTVPVSVDVNGALAQSLSTLDADATTVPVQAVVEVDQALVGVDLEPLSLERTRRALAVLAADTDLTISQDSIRDVQGFIDLSVKPVITATLDINIETEQARLQQQLNQLALAAPLVTNNNVQDNAQVAPVAATSQPVSVTPTLATGAAFALQGELALALSNLDGSVTVSVRLDLASAQASLTNFANQLDQTPLILAAPLLDTSLALQSVADVAREINSLGNITVSPTVTLAQPGNLADFGAGVVQTVGGIALPVTLNATASAASAAASANAAFVGALQASYSIAVDLNVSEILAQINSISDRIEDLIEDRVIEIQINSRVQEFFTGGAVQRFAQGGSVNGPGGIDNVPAMLTAGEFVITRSGSNLLDAIRYFADQGSRSIPGLNLAPQVGLQNFMDGGLVQPFAASEPSDLNPVNINIGGRKRASIFAKRDQVDNLADLFAELSNSERR